MNIRFWGVRGSIASPGPETASVGGNTSCVEVRCGERRIVLDAGTGLRSLGNALARDPASDLTLLLSHFHWDHIQGLPFFVPAYLPQTKLTVVGAGGDRFSLRDKLSRQMTEPHFPVQLDDLSAQMTFREACAGQTFDLDGGIVVKVARLNHPGGVFAYRIEHAGRALVYATDTEHYACVDPALKKLAEGADVLIYDAQYTPDEYQGKVGWGHSTYVAGAEVARAAGVGKLVLFHHDPMRTDEGVAAIEDAARALFPSTVAAREGLVLAMGDDEHAAHAAE
ncbi:MAG TPA: MBL fold metallo-hydrolase [Polyangiaceae bacterium]